MNSYLTVSKLNQYIKSLVESEYSLMNVVVIGEVSGLTKHYTGHFYFTLKDESSQIKCMMFASYTSKLNFSLENGMLVLIKGYIGVYEKGGTYQLYCRDIMLYGEGEYLLNLEKLKQKLLQEGILDKEKKQIPYIPNRIGLITASTGAAMRDYITTVKSRLNTEIYLFPCLVQGEDAPKSIINALKTSLDYNCDLIVITRGGGSKEDLKVFNDEQLVRFVSEIDIPLISAIGHKIDTTLIDYVSSYCAITPTDAAIHSVPDKLEIKNKIESLSSYIDLKVRQKLDKLSEKITLYDRIIELNSPTNKLIRIKEDISNYQNNINRITRSYLNKLVDKLASLKEKIEYLNPYNLLKTGYGLISDENDKIISSINEVEVEQTITIEMNGGRIKAVVKEKKYDI